VSISLLLCFSFAFDLLLWYWLSSFYNALSLEPTGTAERRMKAGRGHVCNITICWSRSNSSRYTPCRYRAPSIARRGRIRLFGANILFPFLPHLLFLSLLVGMVMTLMIVSLGCPCPRICPRGCSKRTETCTSEEAERQEGGSSSSSIRGPIGFCHASSPHMCMLNYGDHI
jgi:hypothetical protein